MKLSDWFNDPVAVDISMTILRRLTPVCVLAVLRHGRQGLVQAGLAILAFTGVGVLWADLYGISVSQPFRVSCPTIMGGLICFVLASAGMSGATVEYAEA